MTEYPNNAVCCVDSRGCPLFSIGNHVQNETTQKKHGPSCERHIHRNHTFDFSDDYDYDYEIQWYILLRLDISQVKRIRKICV
eukprot:scaffold69322_cov106-Attheya_sp.AAC.1